MTQHHHGDRRGQGEAIGNRMRGVHCRLAYIRCRAANPANSPYIISICYIGMAISGRSSRYSRMGYSITGKPS
jgi:hypothetical protein